MKTLVYKSQKRSKPKSIPFVDNIYIHVHELDLTHILDLSEL